MLHAHPDVCFGAETHFFKKMIIYAQLHGGTISGKELLDRLQKYRIRERSSMDWSQIQPEMEIRLDDLTSMFMEVLATACPEVPTMGDKDTEYVRYIPHLHFYFPDAYLIHIVRDPRDVLASRKKAGWSKDTLSAFHAAEYQYYMDRVPAWGKEYFKERYISLRYEDLISAPEDSLKVMCDQLGLEYQAAMLNYHEQNEALVEDDERAWKENVFKPVLGGNAGKWKESLTSRELGMVEVGYEDQMTEWGYELDGGGRLSYLDRLLREAYRFALIRKTQREAL
jgi:hypothetical protein